MALRAPACGCAPCGYEHPRSWHPRTASAQLSAHLEPEPPPASLPPDPATGSDRTPLGARTWVLPSVKVRKLASPSTRRWTPLKTFPPAVSRATMSSAALRMAGAGRRLRLISSISSVWLLYSNAAAGVTHGHEVRTDHAAQSGSCSEPCPLSSCDCVWTGAVALPRTVRGQFERSSCRRGAHACD